MLQSKVLAVNGTTMLPLREVSYLARAIVDWDGRTGTVTITTEGTPEDILNKYLKITRKYE